MKKRFILPVLALLPNLSMAEPKLEKVVAVQQTQIKELQSAIVEIRSSQFTIGSVQQSLLSEAQFQEQMGTGWVLCDGRDVSGSSFQTLGYGSKVPDCRGRFLRILGNKSAPLGQHQANATNAAGLSVANNFSVSYTRPSVQVDTKTGLRTKNAGSHSHGVNHNASRVCNPNHERNCQVGGDTYGWQRPASISVKSAGDHSHAVNDHNHTARLIGGGVKFNGSSWINGGGTETRPDNVTVNAFIKIN